MGCGDHLIFFTSYREYTTVFERFFFSSYISYILSSFLVVYDRKASQVPGVLSWSEKYFVLYLLIKFLFF